MNLPEDQMPAVERFEFALHAGECQSVEDWIDESGEISASEDRILELILSEYRFYRTRGDTPSDDEYMKRFPRLEVRIRRILQLERSLDEFEAEDASSSTEIDCSIHIESATSEAAVSDLTQRYGLPSRYRVIRELGRGGMGSVLLAHDDSLNRQVAIKLPLLDQVSDQLKARMIREARAIAALDDHSGICRIHDIGETRSGTIYISMAYLDGKTLQEEMVHTGKGGSDRETAELVRSIALSLEHAHQKGILHRDLKPSNVMINRGGKPILLDFGLAKIDSESAITQSTDVVGTVLYCAPEQVSQVDPVGPQADVYSLGVVMFQLLTGKTPFQGSVPVVLNQLMHDSAPEPASIRSDVDAGLSRICHRALARHPSDRFASMQEFAGSIDLWLQDPMAIQSINRKLPNDVRFRSIVRIGALMIAALLMGALMISGLDRWGFMATPPPTHPTQMMYSGGTVPLELEQTVRTVYEEQKRQILAVDFCDQGGFVLTASQGFSLGSGLAKPRSMDDYIGSLNEIANVVAFADNEGWVVGSRSGAIRPNSGNFGRPSSMDDVIQNWTDSGHSIAAISFNDQGAWIVCTTEGLVERGGKGRPPDLDERVDLLIKDGKVITAIAFDDAGNWILFADAA